MGGAKKDKGCGGGESIRDTHENIKMGCHILYNYCMLIL